MRIAVCLLLITTVGCSNAPIAGTMDCLFPSKAGRGTIGGGRTPTDRDTLPSPELPTRPIEPRRDFPTSRQGDPEPKIDDTWRRPTTDRERPISDRDLPELSRPLPPPSIDRN